VVTVSDQEEVLAIFRKYPEAARAIMDFGHFRLNEIEEAIATSRDEAKEITSVLIRHRLLNRDSRGYSKTPMLIKMIRDLERKEGPTLDFAD
jgi:hypothetical protein